MLTNAFVQVWPEGYRESSNEVGSLSPAECLAEAKVRNPVPCHTYLHNKKYTISWLT